MATTAIVKSKPGGPWLTQWVEYATLDLGVMDSSPTLDVDYLKKKKKPPPPTARSTPMAYLGRAGSR